MSIILKWVTQNKIKNLIVFAFAALLLASCEKEGAILPSNGDSLVANTTKQGYSLRKLNCVGCDPSGANCTLCDCEGSGGNCLDDVVVSQAHRAAMDSVFTAINTGVQATIKNAFTTHKSMLTQYLATNDVNAVINGTATTKAEPGSKSSRFIIIRNTQGAITAAYPIFTN